MEYGGNDKGEKKKKRLTLRGYPMYKLVKMGR